MLKTSKAYAKIQNLTMRMSMRHFKRFANAFSKKADNLKAAVALHYTHYDFVGIHRTLRTSAARETGIDIGCYLLEICLS